MESRHYFGGTPTRISYRSNGDLQAVWGYASVFYDPDDPGTEFQIYSDLRERIMPGAFDRALREGQDVVCLFNHEPDNILGRTSSGTMRLKCDRRGLIYETLPGDTSIARDLCQHLARGDVSGSSFSFEVLGQRFIEASEEMTIRELTDLQLYDVGPVTFPAYESTTATAGVRSARPGSATNGRRQVLDRATQIELDMLRRTSREEISRRGREVALQMAARGLSDRG